MPQTPKPRLLTLMIVLAMVISAGTLLGSPNANSQESDIGEAKAPANFSRLNVKPGSLGFKKLTFPAGPSSETRSFVITNEGRGTTALDVTVNNPTGNGAASFQIISGGGFLAPLLPGAQATVTVLFSPVQDKGSSALIEVTSDATKGAQSHNVHLSGNAKGPIPSPSPTLAPTATATATPTPTATASPSATASPGPVSTDKNSANAPGIAISGSRVTVYVPLGSDDNNTHGAMRVVVEDSASPLPTPALLATDRSNSCTPSTSGEVICSGQGGSVDLIPAGGGAPVILPLSAGAVPDINYTNGDCMACGAMVDDVLNLGIVSSGLGFVPINLVNGTVGSPIAVNQGSADPNTVPGMDFGYDMANHRILSANYQVTDAQFNQSHPHFEIIDISNPASPVIYELANDQAFFLSNGRTCGAASTDNDKLPDTTALDTSTNIAYVTFHTPSDCFNAPPDDIAMFDLSQAVFTLGTAGNPNTWTTPLTAIQSITGTGLNGIDPISVEAVHHLALVSAGDNNFGVLQLPSASGSGASLTIPDWVNAQMPNDPNNVSWAGWHQPDGLATYVSPNTGKVMGVLMNNPMTNGVFTGSTFLAIVDMDDLLNPAVTSRDPSPGNGHKVDGSVNLVTSGIVRFVKVQ
jgi:hypothetical protein